MSTTRAWLSLGSNVEPERHLRAALDELRARFGALVVSPVYRTPSVGFEGPDFLNLAVGIDSDLDAVALDAWLHALEDRHGRRRDVPRFSSRTLDVDIVLFGDAAVRGPGNLEIPRGELIKHAFVLRPMARHRRRGAAPVAGPHAGAVVARLPARRCARGDHARARRCSSARPDRPRRGGGSRAGVDALLGSRR